MFNIGTPSNSCKCNRCSDKIGEEIDIEALKQYVEIMMAVKLEVFIKNSIKKTDSQE